LQYNADVLLQKRANLRLSFGLFHGESIKNE
jgi:hypothetical protein